MATKPTVQELLRKPKEDIVAFLGSVYEHSLWVAEALVLADPQRLDLQTVSNLAEAMKKIVDEASLEQKMHLLCAHPDLCEKVGNLRKLSQDSQEEQSKSGLQSLTLEELDRFNQLNTAYREKFGFPFILAVRNSTKYTVLSALAGRIHHSFESEFAAALTQVHKIAWMRLLAKINLSDAKGFLTCHVLDTANGCPGK
jgi:2-oxo-4-hydroxy-4-carboxy-5-ureidoimidazoline decarboxylase